MSLLTDRVRRTIPASLRDTGGLEPLGAALADGDALAAWPHWQALLAQVAPQAEPALIRTAHVTPAGDTVEHLEVAALMGDLGAAGAQVLRAGTAGDGRLDWPDTTVALADGGIDVTDGWLQLRGTITLGEVAQHRSMLLCTSDRLSDLDDLLVGAAYRLGLPAPGGGYAPETLVTGALLAARTLAEGTPTFYVTEGWEDEGGHAVATISAPSSPTHHACPVRLRDLLLTG